MFANFYTYHGVMFTSAVYFFMWTFGLGLLSSVLSFQPVGFSLVFLVGKFW